MNIHYNSCDHNTGQINRYNPFGHNHVALNSAAIQYIYVSKIKSQLLLIHALLRKVCIAPLNLVVKYGLEVLRNIPYCSPCIITSAEAQTHAHGHSATPFIIQPSLTSPDGSCLY